MVKRSLTVLLLLSGVLILGVVLAASLGAVMVPFDQVAGLLMEEKPKAACLPRSGFMARLQRHPQEETTLIVAYSGPLWVLLCTLLGIELRRLWQMRLDPGSVSLVETYPEGAIICFLNDASHLKLRG